MSGLPNTLKSLKKLWQPLSAQGTSGLTYSVINSTLTVLSSSALMANSAYIISFAALQPSIADIMIPVTMVRFFGIARAGLRYTERLISHNAVFSYLSRLRVWLYEGYTQLSGRALLNINRNDALQTLTADIEVLQDFFLRALLPLLSSSLIGLLLTVVLLVKLPQFAPVFLLFYVIGTFGMAWVAWQLTKGSSAAHAKVLGTYKRHYSEYAEGIAELKWNERSQDYSQQLTDLAETLEQHQEKTAIARIIAANGQQLVVYLTVFAALIFGINAVSHGMNPIYLAVVTLVMFSFYEAAPAFLTLFQKLESSGYSAERMSAIQGQETRASLSGGGLATHQPESFNGLIYEGLSYQYPTAPKPVRLDGLQIAPGDKIAIVGPSGSGKSTISAMLTGLLEPFSGSVTTLSSGKGISDTETLSSLFATVNQSVYLFNKSLKDNLRLANVNASEEQLHTALKEAGLADWLDTTWYDADPYLGENGMQISGGQRQRLALARAFLKEAPVLLLDEAFAGLDKATEAEILNSLLKDETRTLVWITHRLIAMEALDCIYVMDQGEVVARGKHSELLISCPLYAAMVDIQNQIV